MAIAMRQPVFIITSKALFDGNGLTFEELFHTYYGPLCRFAFTLVNSTEAAEEIVSDVFLKVWRNKENLVIKSSLQSYLFTSVRNQSIDYLRKVVRLRTLPEEISPEIPSDYDSPEERAIWEELELLIENAINALPPQGRKIFRLSRDNGMKYHEIAEHLHISIKTVETHMGRSLKHLRETLQAQYAF
ncbi:MAG: RNA polymerase sigma-70 factor [Saprospiraceae bacterium]